jgi:hypothetical protein
MHYFKVVEYVMATLRCLETLGLRPAVVSKSLLEFL